MTADVSQIRSGYRTESSSVREPAVGDFTLKQLAKKASSIMAVRAIE